MSDLDNCACWGLDGFLILHASHCGFCFATILFLAIYFGSFCILSTNFFGGTMASPVFLAVCWFYCRRNFAKFVCKPNQVQTFNFRRSCQMSAGILNFSQCLIYSVSLDLKQISSVSHCNGLLVIRKWRFLSFLLWLGDVVASQARGPWLDSITVTRPIHKVNVCHEQHQTEPVFHISITSAYFLSHMLTNVQDTAGHSPASRAPACWPLSTLLCAFDDPGGK